MSKFLCVPCIVSLFVFAAVAMVRGSQDHTRTGEFASVSRQSTNRLAELPAAELMSVEEANAAILDGWPAGSRVAIFSRRLTTTNLSAEAHWYQANDSQSTDPATGLVGQLVVMAIPQPREIKEAEPQTRSSQLQQLPVYVDRTSRKILIHADGQWQPYQDWLAIELPKLKKLTGLEV
ncbi:MAG: hypothetical protein WBD20_02435 [Pirellulaceae bacterium]